MNKVYKYTEIFDYYVKVLLPKNARILKVDSQDDGASRMIQIWALVKPGEPMMMVRTLRIAGTGHPIQEAPENLMYINTFTMMKRAVWFHVFELI
jgi:hypothetical protein